MFLDTNVIILILDLLIEKKYKDTVDEYGRKKDLYISNIVLGEVLGYQGYTNEQANIIYKRIKKGFKIVKVDTKITLLASEIGRASCRERVCLAV